VTLTESFMLKLGTAAPDFALPNTVDNTIVTLSGYTQQPLLVMFICNHCPYVIHLAEQLVSKAREFQQQGVAVVAISSNDISTHPQDGPEHMTSFAQQYGFTFPYLYDEMQAIAKAYQAECTPDLYLFDAKHRLYYRGRFDASTPGNSEPVTGQDLTAAVTALLNDQSAPTAQLPSMGCNIKWKESI
jgi:peroxiredoxin